MEKFAPFEKLPKKKQRELKWAKRGSWYGINPVTASRKTQKRTTDERHRNGVMALILCLLLFLR